MLSQAAFVLHRYPYQDQHFLLKLLTEQNGLLTAIIKRLKHRNSLRTALAEPFTLLHLSLRGRGDVLTVASLEAHQPRANFSPAALYSAFYLNELLLYLLPAHEPFPLLFFQYQQALADLSKGALGGPLRTFELQLFKQLGFAPTLEYDSRHQAIDPKRWYQLKPDHLPKEVLPETEPTSFLFQGEELLGIAQAQWSDRRIAMAAKRLMRQWVAFYCKGKPFKSREMFSSIGMAELLVSVGTER